MPHDPAFRIGVVVHDRGDEAEDLLAAFVTELRAEGRLHVTGLYQRTIRNADGPNRMEVVDIASGTAVLISQPLGSGSSSCCLDPTGLAEAAAFLRRAREAAPDLLVVNKFAGAEADGEGLAEEMFAAICDGMPVLVLVARRYVESWAAASGGAGEILPPRLPELRAWAAGLPSADRRTAAAS